VEQGEKVCLMGSMPVRFRNLAPERLVGLQPIPGVHTLRTKRLSFSQLGFIEMVLAVFA